MTPKQLKKLGKSAYGEHWQTALSRDVKVNPKTVRRWLAGTTPIRPIIESAIKTACGRRKDEVSSLRR